MAKFVFYMESILQIKQKLEDQAKVEYSNQMAKLRLEEEKLERLRLRRMPCSNVLLSRSVRFWICFVYASLRMALKI